MRVYISSCVFTQNHNTVEAVLAHGQTNSSHMCTLRQPESKIAAIIHLNLCPPGLKICGQAHFWTRPDPTKSQYILKSLEIS
jgi:hypothetical protein